MSPIYGRKSEGQILVNGFKVVEHAVVRGGFVFGLGAEELNLVGNDFGDVSAASVGSVVTAGLNRSGYGRLTAFFQVFVAMFRLRSPYDNGKEVGISYAVAVGKSARHGKRVSANGNARAGVGEFGILC